MSSNGGPDCSSLRTQIIANLRFIYPHIPSSTRIEIVTSHRYIAAVSHELVHSSQDKHTIDAAAEAGARKVLRQVKTMSVTDPLLYGRGTEMRLRDALVELLESTEIDVGKILDDMERVKIVKEKCEGLV